MSNAAYKTLDATNQIELDTPLQQLFAQPAAPYEPEPESLDEENDRVVHINDRTILLLGKAVEHVRVMDSLDTAQQLMGRAYRRCASVYNKRLISVANKSLRAAIKSDAWAKSKRRRRHVDEHTRKKNLDTFFERVAEVVASVQQDTDKRTKRLFVNVKRQYTSDLPTTLSKGYTLRTAHVAVMSVSVPRGQQKITKLEGGKTNEGALFLVENANVIGVNRALYPKPLAKANAVARARGVTVYPEPISRPSENVTWYLVQDFGASLTFVSFADSLTLHGEENGGSYESFIRNREDQQKRNTQLKTTRLRALREAFMNDNVAIFTDRHALQIELDNLVAAQHEAENDFIALTVVGKGDFGLHIGQYSRLSHHMETFLENRLREGHGWLEAKRLTFEQRIAARTKYFEYKSLGEQASAIRTRLNWLKAELDHRRQQQALELGLVSLTKLTNLAA